MAKNWTDAQKSAMNTRNKTLLVSAAAGSGKTATLTERIIRRITLDDPPADISKMLIVTFTRVAAAELRSRIFSALGDALAADPSNDHLASQLMKIGSAKISTIDSFYLDIIRANFSTLGISAGFRTADDSEYDLIARRVMEESIEFMYENDPRFPVFTECFGTVRSSINIADIFLDIYSDLESLPEGIDYVKYCAEKTEAQAELDFMATSYGNNLRSTTKDFCEHYSSIFSSALLYMQTDDPMRDAYEKSFIYDLEYCRSLSDAISNEQYGYLQTQQLLNSYNAISLGSLAAKNKSEISEQYKNMRTAFSNKIKALRAKTFSKSPAIISRAMYDTSAHLFTLYDLLLKFDSLVNEEKERRSLMTFTDIRRATLKLLVDDDGNPTDIAKKYAEQFTDIFIDEYQDVDRVQDLIFSSIAKPDNRFMVGDIKQSIYGFRGAEPMLFSSYRRKFPALESAEGEASENATIFMSDNFRCDKNVIDFTNTVCSAIFSVCTESIGYTDKDDLGFSKEPPSKDYVSPKVKLAIVTAPVGEDFEDIDKDADARRVWEAEYIAEEIARLMREEKKADGSAIQPSDIAVLFRAKSMSAILAQALAARGIPYAESDAERYFENSDVLMMLSVLNAIDNPERDIYLAGTLSSPIFNFSVDELITIRRDAPKNYSLFGAVELYANEYDNELANKCNGFIADLRAWQNDAASLSVERFLRLLFESERFVASGVVSQTDSHGDGGNLLMLYEYARKFENGSFKGLYQFVEYINSVLRDGGKLSGENKLSSDNRVSLMTVHKSKGLEFPVCFVCNTTCYTRSQDI
ncbi:MAG: UvrD-helicase domain-containing protein [Clostridia bacterium]|nr:UvrD-helicase domain-containing protein [Clostridia bacterium]